MTLQQGDLQLLNTDTAQQLLVSKNLARLAYVWPDGTPRVVPIWFHWNGEEVVMASPAAAPKVKALAACADVAITIDADTFPNDVLLIRGRADLAIVDDVVPEYALAAKRYFGEEGGDAWVSQLQNVRMARIAVRPQWIAVLDFRTRFPSAIGGVAT